MTWKRTIATGLALVVAHQIGLGALLATGVPPRPSIVAAAVLFLLLPLALFLRTAGVPVAPALRLRPVPAPLSLLGAAAFLSVVPAITAVTGRFATVPESMEEFFGDLMRASSAPEWAWVIVVAAVVPAVSEEVVFRGYLQRALEGRAGRWPAIVIVSLLFGLIHGPVRMPTATALGLVLGWLASRADSLLPSMLAHAAANAAAIVVANVDAGAFEAEGGSDIPWGFAAGSAALGVALLTAYARSTPQSGPIPSGPVAPAPPPPGPDSNPPPGA